MFPWSPQSLLPLSDFSGVTLCPPNKCVKLSLISNALKTNSVERKPVCWDKGFTNFEDDDAQSFKFSVRCIKLILNIRSKSKRMKYMTNLFAGAQYFLH